MVFKDEDIHSAMRFCLKNAENLVAEAQLLYDAGRFPRAYCLAVQAMSELGKRSLLAINLGGKLNDNKSLEKFHKQWLSAEKCLLLSLMTGSMQEFSREEYSDLIRLSRLWLMRGHDLMGVEVYEGTGFTDPDARIKKEDSEHLINLAKARVEIDKQRTVKRPDEISEQSKEDATWLQDNSENKEFVAFVNSKESLDKFAELKDSLAWVRYLRSAWSEVLQKDSSIISEEHVKDKRWYVESRIFSYSHIWTQEAVDYWNKTCNCLKMKIVNEREVDIKQVLPELFPDNDLYIKSLMATMIHVVAMNVGSFGHFWWSSPAWPFRFTKIYDLMNKRDVHLQVNRKKDDRVGDRRLTKDDMYRTMMVFGALSKLNERYFELYIKATTLMGSDTFDNNFYAEAFSNYFLIMERFIKVEILNQRGGELKLKTMQKALTDLGISDDLVQEFKNLYIVRGRDAMHSRGHEQDLTHEEAGKCKIMCDLMLFKYCEEKFKSFVADENGLSTL